MRNKFLLSAILLLLVALSAQAATITLPKIGKSELKTPEINKTDDVFIEADQLEYDTQTKVVVASGKVEILKGENVLFADKVTYDQNTNFVTANGNVVVTGPEGNTIFTDNFVLKNDLSEGVIKYFRTRLSDGSLLAAAQARRIDDNKLVLHKAVYSPCPICTNKPDSYPQWQLKADKVTVDDVAQKVSYNDAQMEVYGIPVFYTPYFSHATPNADRKSGFLVPSFQTDSNLGAMITTPYYWNIAPNMDLTALPVVTTKEGPVAGAQFRHLTNYGEYNLEGSVTVPTDRTQDTPDVRGHFRGSGRFDLTENWDTGFDGEYSSDDTYMRRYNYGNDDLLTSRAYLERIKDRDYSNIQTVHFQGLLEQDDSDKIPFALPYVRNHFESRKGIIPGFGGSSFTTDLSGLAINRQEGADNQRGSIKSDLNIPLVSPGGQIIELNGSLRTDQYYTQNSSFDEQESRVIPEASVTWRYPLMNQLTKSGKMILEPITKLVISPNKDYNKDIPNEDSQDVEFSDLNVFDNNRFRGLDRVESGTRVYYGLRGGYYEDEYSISYLFGQNYRFQDDIGSIPANSGIEDNLSDYVGRVSTSIYDILDIAYKFRFDKNDFSTRRNEVDVNLDYAPVKLSLTYFNLNYDFTSPNRQREEINGAAAINVVDEWSVLFGGTRNLAEDRNISARAGILYEGDCTNILTTVKRDFISDRDAKSGTSFGIEIGLKNLGNL